jgi:hypothetical protein
VNRLPALCLLATALVLAGPARALRPVTPPAPEFPPSLTWLNSEPFSLDRLHGRRVTVVGFLHPHSGATIRTLPALKRWWDLYALEGLMVIAVFTPEYSFDRSSQDALRNIRRLGLRFPIALDADRRLWNAYGSEGWPSYYLLDESGRIVFDHLGENDTPEFEREILAALERFNGFRSTQAASVPAARGDCGPSTRPLEFVEHKRPSIPAFSIMKFDTFMESHDGEVSSIGEWKLEADGLRSAKPSASLHIFYRGASSTALLSKNGPKPAKLFIRQDNLWLHKGNAGPDILFDDDEQSFVIVDEPRPYGLTRNKRPDMHELLLSPESPGLGIHAVEFANACQTGP